MKKHKKHNELFNWIWILSIITIGNLLGQETIWSENFESNWWVDWHVDAGTWEVGMPTSGPDTTYSGINCAATVLDGNYTEPVNTRLIRHTSFTVPPASENPRLRFWHWFSFSSADNGEVQIKIGDGDWETISVSYYYTGSNAWTYTSIDLSNYEGASVQIAFDFHSAQDGISSNVSSGWYIDDVSLVTGPIVFNNPEDCESGIGDWSVERGTWEIGTPTSGPNECHSGDNCFGTRLDGNYSEPAHSRLITPEFYVLNQDMALQFWHWFSFAAGDYGKIHIKIEDEPWEPIPDVQFNNTSSDIWTPFYFSLSEFFGLNIQIAFYFHSAQDGISSNVSSGWYIDDILIIGLEDCAGVIGGDAFINECGCVGGTTGLEPDFCFGCINPDANNYCEECTLDDGSCIYGILGDVNHDQSVDVLDIVMIISVIMGSNTFDESEFYAADVNSDGFVDVLDIVWLVGCILDSCWTDIYGCTDPEALNYNPDATIDDGSCEYACMDIDGNSYETVVIGDQVWMAENLKVTHYNNGDPILTGFSNSEWINLTTGGYSVYNENLENAEIYGNLYNWYNVNDDRGICPEDWHAPSDEEWTELTDFLGGSAGSQLAGDADLWNSVGLVNNPAFGTSGFDALPGGYRNDVDGVCYSMGDGGYFWSSTASSSNYAWSRRLYYYTSEVDRLNHSELRGFSIRCLKD